MDQNKHFYETTSLVLSSTLVCLGFPLDSVTKNSDGKATFIFLRTDSDLDKVLESFWQRSLNVEPNSFFEAQRFLKSRIYGS